MNKILIAFGCGQGIGFECVSHILQQYDKAIVITRTKHNIHNHKVANLKYIYKDLFLSNIKDEIELFIEKYNPKEVHVINSAAKVGDVINIEDINVDKLNDDIQFSSLNGKVIIVNAAPSDFTA